MANTIEEFQYSGDSIRFWGFEKVDVNLIVTIVRLIFSSFAENEIMATVQLSWLSRLFRKLLRFFLFFSS